MAAKRKRRRLNLQDIALQRTLVYLSAIRPGAPIPVSFLESVVSGDMMLDGSNRSIVDGLEAIPALFHVGLDQVYQLTTRDLDRATIAVTEEQMPVLRQALRELGPDQSWVEAHGLGDPAVGLTVELHAAASLAADEYTLDQHALLVAHGLYWLEQQLGKTGKNAAYGAIQLYDALWLLHDLEVVATSELTPFLEPVLSHCQQYGPDWGEPEPLYFLVSIAEALAVVAEPELLPPARRAFALAKRLRKGLPRRDRKDLRELFHEVRDRAGL